MFAGRRSLNEFGYRVFQLKLPTAFQQDSRCSFPDYYIVAEESLIALARALGIPRQVHVPSNQWPRVSLELGISLQPPQFSDRTEHTVDSSKGRFPTRYNRLHCGSGPCWEPSRHKPDR